MTQVQHQTTHDIVQKLWGLCNLLRDDGVTYHQYVTELTYLLFLKMAEETGTEDKLPEGYRWADLIGKNGSEQLDFYREMLLYLGSKTSGLVREIYAGASTVIKKPTTLSSLLTTMNALDWYSAKEEGLGDLYEGLLQKNAGEVKSGAGQYFTPRPLIESIVALMKPTLEDVVQDPAAGTGGFLIAANHHIREQNDISTLNEAQQRKYYTATFYGMELVQETQRLALMNLMLHNLHHDPSGAGIRLGDTLSPAGEDLAKTRPSLVLSNPPFGTKKGGEKPSRADFTFSTSNKQLAFLQHIYRALRAGGRAAVVLPDNVLFEDGVGREIRADLMDKCRLHTILRLPTGIFYAQGVKTNVLFFTRGEADKGNTEEVWVYDMRTNMPKFGKRTPLTRAHFAEFEAAFGDDPAGGSEALAKRVDGGETGRFRRFTRQQIAERGDGLDISWLKGDEDGGELPEPSLLAAEVLDELESATAELKALLVELNAEDEA